MVHNMFEIAASVVEHPARNDFCNMSVGIAYGGGGLRRMFRFISQNDVMNKPIRGNGIDVL